MEYKLISFDIWKQYVKNYTKEYIKSHKIFRHIPSDVLWDISGKVEEVKENVLDYVSTLEMDEIDESFLSLLYNGNSQASYVSGCGFFYENYYDAIISDIESELYSRLSDLNNLNDEDIDDDLYDYVTEIEKEWIYDILAEFTKEDVIEILKDNKFCQ